MVRMPRIQTPLEPAQLDHLRSLLKGRTWRDVCRSTAALHTLTYNEVWFYGRIGCFMNRPCIAVCARNHFVVLNYSHGIDGLYDLQLLHKKYVLDATPEKGITLFEADLEALGINTNSPILGREGD